jgi:hypothetical protein
MKKTAAHIASSPNAVQLEMRILANHGDDPRFAFLRGRWKRRWQEIKANSRTNPVTDASKAVPPSSSALVTYKEDEPHEPDDEAQQKVDEQQIKAERLARVKEWARKRKEEKK